MFLSLFLENQYNFSDSQAIHDLNFSEVLEKRKRSKLKNLKKIEVLKLQNVIYFRQKKDTHNLKPHKEHEIFSR